MSDDLYKAAVYADLKKFRYIGMGIPVYMHEAIADYIVHRDRPGDFLQAIVCNDLGKASAHADGTNVCLLAAYHSFFYTYAPSACHGSKEAMEAWLENT